MVHLEFTVAGVPVSHQSKNRERLREWQEQVRSAAAAAWGDRLPLTEQVGLTVTFYHEGGTVRLDVENLRKPIQDAMNRLVYRDDVQVIDARTHKRPIDRRYRVRGVSLVLLEGFSRGLPFVHIRVTTPDDPAVLPGTTS